MEKPKNMDEGDIKVSYASFKAMLGETSRMGHDFLWNAAMY